MNLANRIAKCSDSRIISLGGFSETARTLLLELIVIIMHIRGTILLTISIAVCLALSACGNAASDSNSGTTYAVSPSFREFYETLGGEDVLGPAISQSLSVQSYDCQYTVNVLMCLNPMVADSSRFNLYPLGNSMNVREDPAQTEAQTGSQIINGYTIDDGFMAYYQKLSGERFTGKPITQVHINYSQKRYEQFFENVGFYRKFGDTSGTVHLLAYGAFSCNTECDYTPSVDSIILNAAKASSDQPMLAGLAKMGDTSVLGAPLTEPYIATDGMEEQVYQNAVVYAPTGNLSNASLRPLTTLLNIPKTDLVKQQYGTAENMVFYPLKGSLGLHVPIPFDRFIAAHGGLDYSGNPIDEVFQYDGNIYRQCYEKYCLDFDSTAQTVSMAPLGQLYYQQIGGSNTPAPQPLVISPDTVTLQVSEQYKEVSAQNPQKIDILVIRKDNQQPVTNIEAVLSITLPDGSLYTADLPQTGMDGRASIIVPSMKNITNGTILVYQVCLKGTTDTPVCISDSYLIWGGS